MTENELIWQIQFATDGRDALWGLHVYLATAPLFDLLGCAGENTWQGNTPDTFRERVQYQRDRLISILDEIWLAEQQAQVRIADLQHQLAHVREADRLADVNEAV